MVSTLRCNPCLACGRLHERILLRMEWDDENGGVVWRGTCPTTGETLQVNSDDSIEVLE